MMPASASTQTRRRIIDVGALPTFAFGPRDPMWWAVVLVTAIEGTMLLLLAIAYYYVADRTSPWPPVRAGHEVAHLATLDLVLLIGSIWPAHAASKAAIAGDARGMRRELTIVSLFGAACLALRGWIFARLPFAWDGDAYASVVWLMLGLQTFHLLTGVLEDALLLAICVRGPIEHKHRVDVEISTVLWYFVIAGALLQWAVVFLDIYRSPLPPGGLP